MSSNKLMKKGMKDLMGKMGKKSPVKEIDPALDNFAKMVNKDKKKAAGGMMKKKGYAMGGKMMKKGYKKGGKVRGAGMASKGVRPAKMVTMKGS